MANDNVDYLIFTDDETTETSMIVTPAYTPGYVVEVVMPVEDAEEVAIELSKEEVQALIEHLTQLLDSDDGI